MRFLQPWKHARIRTCERIFSSQDTYHTHWWIHHARNKTHETRGRKCADNTHLFWECMHEYASLCDSADFVWNACICTHSYVHSFAVHDAYHSMGPNHSSFRNSKLSCLIESFNLYLCTRAYFAVWSNLNGVLASTCKTSCNGSFKALKSLFWCTGQSMWPHMWERACHVREYDFNTSCLMLIGVCWSAYIKKRERPWSLIRTYLSPQSRSTSAPDQDLPQPLIKTYLSP